MGDTKNAFDPRRFVLDPGYAEGKTGRKIKGKRVVFNDDGSYSPAAGRETNRNHPKCSWVGFSHKELLELARQTRNPLLAVLAELACLHYRAWDKSRPIPYSNSGFQNLGFSHHDKIRALKNLANAGWVSVQWRKNRSPLVTILRGFQVGS